MTTPHTDGPPQVIQADLRESEGLSTAERAKPLADAGVVEDLLKFLWLRDEYQYPQHRMRIQVCLSIILLWYLGLRTGEMVESKEHVGDNEGLLWKDFEISMQADANGSPVFCAKVSIRNRKGKRKQANKV